jgi:hypothetical protein
MEKPSAYSAGGPPSDLDFEKSLMFFHAYMYGPLQGKLRLYAARGVRPGPVVKSEACWKNDRGRTRFRGTEIATPVAIVDPDATVAFAVPAAPAHFRSFCTTGDVGRLTAGATR